MGRALEERLMGISLDAIKFLEGVASSKTFLEAEAMVIERERAGRIVNRAKELVPVETGELRDSIKIQGEGVDKGMPYVDVGSTDEHALYVEYGTSHSQAEPFLRPAIAEER
jgi:HK97 gp10 family phage protein